MTPEDKALIEEHIKLQRELREYIKEHGFDYGEYCAAPPGSFYEQYRKRWLELTHKLTPALGHPGEEAA